MYYLYLDNNYNFSSPKYLIAEYEEHYFYRDKNTDWFEMEEDEIEKMLSGKDNRYYAIEEKQFLEVLHRWGGSIHGYKSMNIYHAFDHEGYADSYDEEDEIDE